MNYPSRRAILIASQTPSGLYLQGIEGDIARMQAHLSSPLGGDWYDDEITTLNNPTTRQVLNTIFYAEADYVLVYFSGHGFSYSNDHRMICLTDGNLRDTQLLNNSLRQLVMVDSCRTRRERAAIGDILGYEEAADSFTGYSYARDLFDRRILSSLPGKMIVHATSDQTFALENQARNGGEFTLALLDGVIHCQEQGYDTVLSIKYAVQHASAILQNRAVKQVPCMYMAGNLSVPFAIVSPDFIRISPPTRNRVLAKQNDEWAAFFKIAGLTLLVAAVIK